MGEIYAICENLVCQQIYAIFIYIFCQSSIFNWKSTLNFLTAAAFPCSEAYFPTVALCSAVNAV